MTDTASALISSSAAVASMPAAPAAAPVKPGWATSEHWLVLIAMIIGALPSSGLLPPTGDAVKIVGLAITVLAALGYTGARTLVKTTAMLFLFFGLTTQTSACATTKADVAIAGTAVKTAVVDCTKGELPAVVAAAAPIAASLLVMATGGDGKVDWSQAAAATKGLAKDDAGCILTKAVQTVLTAPPPKPGAPASSPLVVDREDLLAHLQAHVGGTHYHTELGDL